LQQTVLTVPTWLEFRMDVCIVATNGNAQGGIIDVKVGGNLAGTWQRCAGTISPGTYRDQLVFRFKPTVVGNQPLDIEMGRPRYIWSTSTPLMPGERKATPTSNTLGLMAAINFY
jgi:hypothetical protein